MDTITHGFAGALIGKAVFRGKDLFARGPLDRGRLITWAAMLGSIFPDSDTFREMLSKNDLLVMTWHRSITHSLLLLPLWSVLLAALTRWFAQKQKWPSPSLAALSGIYAVGILSHILLDLVTTFGTMIWSPLQWSRPAWDLIFIVDFTLAGILLLPQFLAWAFAKPETYRQRAILLWIPFLLAPALIARFALIVGAPISDRAILSAMAVVTLLFVVPLFRGSGLRVPFVAWQGAGLLLAFVYVGLAAAAHHRALQRIATFANFEHLEQQSVAALPFPPSIFNWDGLVLTPRGVYEMRIDLSDDFALADQTKSAAASVEQNPQAAQPSLEYKFYPDAADNAEIEQAKRLPAVQTFLWFARFPVTRFHKEGSNSVVELSDARFPALRPGRPSSFTYEVTIDGKGNVISQGWKK